MSSHPQNPRAGQGSHPSSTHSRPETPTARDPLTPTKYHENHATTSKNTSPASGQKRSPGAFSQDYDHSPVSSASRSRNGQTHTSAPKRSGGTTSATASGQHGGAHGESSSNPEYNRKRTSSLISPPRERTSEFDHCTKDALVRSPRSRDSGLADRSPKATNQANSRDGSVVDDKAVGSVMLAVNAKQTVHSNSHLTCYSIDKPSPGTQKAPMGLSSAAIAKGLSQVNSNVPLTSMLSDHQGSLVLFSDSPDSDSSIQLPGCKINLTKIATIRGKDLLEFLHSTRSFGNKTLQEAVLDVVQTLLSQKSPSNHLESVRRKSLPALEICSGPSQSKEYSLVESIKTFMRDDPQNLHGLETYLRGLRVHVRQNQDMNAGSDSSKTKTIIGLARPDDGQKSSSPPKVRRYGGSGKEVEFYNTWKGKYLTVFDYFQDHKGQPIRNANLPLVNVGTRSKPTYISPDFCTVLVRHEQNSSVLDFGDVMQITKNALVANANMPQWLNNYDADERSRHPGLKMPLAGQLSKCQISVTADALLMSCRTEKAPTIKYLEGKEFAPHSGAWNLTLSGLEANEIVPVRGKVAVLVVKQGRWPAEEQTTKTLQALQNRLKSFGLDLSKSDSPLPVVMKDCKLEQDVKDEIRSKLSEAMNGKKVKAMVIMLPTKSRPLYEYIKSVCDVWHGIHSVCIDSLKLASAENDNGYSFQTALKLNIKTGGRNQTLHSYQMENIDLKSTMIVGIDILTSPKREKNMANNDVLFMVSSISPDLSQWPAAIRKVPANQPVHQTLFDLLETRIALWKEKQQHNPSNATLKNIIIYHNGLASNTAAATRETASFRYTLGKHTWIDFTLIAVHKDHHTKIQLPPSSSNPAKGNDDATPTIPTDTIISRSPSTTPYWSFLIHSPKPQSPTTATTTTTLSAESHRTLPIRCTVLHDDIFTDDDD
ncbi:MAG: hypothetical protein Q9200_006808, partial [Gallowayella weberi]